MKDSNRFSQIALATSAAALFATVALSGRDERIERDRIR